MEREVLKSGTAIWRLLNVALWKCRIQFYHSFWFSSDVEIQNFKMRKQPFKKLFCSSKQIILEARSSLWVTGLFHSDWLIATGTFCHYILQQHFSNCTMFKNHLENVLHHRLLASTVRGSDRHSLQVPSWYWDWLWSVNVQVGSRS